MSEKAYVQVTLNKTGKATYSSKNPISGMNQVITKDQAGVITTASFLSKRNKNRFIQQGSSFDEPNKSTSSNSGIEAVIPADFPSRVVLADSGLVKAKDIIAKDADGLEQIPGIGKAKAKEILEAAEQVRNGTWGTKENDPQEV